MKIGDLFWGLAVDDKGFASDLSAKAGKAGDAAGLTLGQRLSGGFKKAGSGLFAGLGIGAGVAAFGALDTAISSSIHFMGDAIAEARADEESIARLGASLKANIPGWDGNTKAIEASILATQRLGFADDEQRKALAIGVAATHDAAKAQDVLRVAMDLARLKGISLEEASTALVKVEAGQYRALKALGIVLPKNATATQALAAVTKVAAGSAEAYAKTSAGQLLVSQIKVGEAMEKLGYVLLPAVTAAAVVLADAATALADALFGVGDAAAGAAPKTQGLFDSLDEGLVKNTQREFKVLGDIIHNLFGGGQTPLGDALAADLSKSNAAVGNFAGAMHVAQGNVVKDMKDMAAGSTSAATKITDGLQKIIDSAVTVRDRLTTLGQETANAYWDPQILAANLAATERSIAEQRQIVAAKSSTAAQIADAKLRLLELNKTKFEQISALAAYGGQAAKLALAAQIEMLKGVKGATKEQIAELHKLEAAYRALAYAEADAKNKSLGHNTGGVGDRGRASGGSVIAGQAYLVNENTPNSELWVPSISGKVLGPSSTPASAGAAGSGGSGHTFHIYNPVPHAADDDIGRILRRTAVLGLG